VVGKALALLRITFLWWCWRGWQRGLAFAGSPALGHSPQ